MCSSSVEKLLNVCRKDHLKIRTVESCTAGALSAAIASVSGASDVLDRAWVTYSNQAKVEELGVDTALLDKHGAVSEVVACAMAKGGVAEDTYCMAITGIAGPTGGSVEKPVGMVWMAVCSPANIIASKCFQFSGDRQEIQAQAVQAGIDFLYQAILT